MIKKLWRKSKKDWRHSKRKHCDGLCCIKWYIMYKGVYRAKIRDELKKEMLAA